MYVRDSEAVLKQTMHFVAGDFFPPAFHASGFHNGGMGEFYRVLFCKIQQGEGYAKQQGRDLHEFIMHKCFVQRIQIVQIETAVWLLAFPDEAIGHINEGGVGPFQIIGKKAQDAHVGRVSIKLPESLKKTFFIERGSPYQVPARLAASGTAAFKNDFRLEAGGLDGMGFKKVNRKKRNCFDSVNVLRIDAQDLHIFLIHGIVLNLKAKDFQRQLIKLVIGSRENLFLQPVCLKMGIQFLIFKFET